MNLTRKFVITAALALPFSVLATPAMANQNHSDPCSGQHVPVYNEESNVQLPHFVCGPITGPAGKDGKDGADGTPGNDGPAGPAGPAGETGLPGAPGADGKAGVDGEAGPAGPAGASGEVGLTGPQGFKGDMGDDGVQGPKGDAGKNGVTKTVIVTVKADGTKSTEVVPNLPHTGGDLDTLWLAMAGIVVVAGGVALVTAARKK